MQNIGDGINDELRIYSGETSLIPSCPTFGATESTLGERCTWLPKFFRERSDDTILRCSASLISLPVWFCQGAEHR